MQIITSHLNADFDSFGSMIAAKKLFPEARLVFSGSMENTLRNYLKQNPSPYKIFRLRDISLPDVRQLILVNTQDPNRIGPFRELLNRSDVEVYIYDHHLNVELEIACHQATLLKRGSSCTVLFEELRSKDISLTPDECTLMVLGIYKDTHSLSANSSTPEDFFAAGELVRCGANLDLVSEFVELRLNRKQVGLINDLIQNLEMYSINGIEIVLGTASIDHYVEDLAFAVHKIRNLENLVSFFALVRMDQRIQIIGRSDGKVLNVANILRQLGGNGHPSAASASVRELTLAESKERLLGILEETTQPKRLVRDIMHFPVIFVGGADSVDKVESLLTRFNLNTVPVIQDEKPIGLVTRQIIEKAIHHKMGQEPIEDFMIREFMMTSPDSFFKSITPAIIEQKQKLVPVVDEQEGRILGVVTRGDLLDVMHEEGYRRDDSSNLFEDSERPLKRVKSLVKERLPKHIISLLEIISQTADALEMSVYLVGGFVRDLLLNIPNLDIDIVVEGDGIEFAKALGKQLNAKTRSHAKFCTSVMILPDGSKIDIATARMEYYQHSGALPTVEKSSIKADLFRRDFTINSLAIKLNGKDNYGLLDFFNGQRDLKDKAIRVLHNLSFIEDPSRAYRAVRFEQRFQFFLGKQTELFLKHIVKKRLTDGLSGHRLWSELHILLQENKPVNNLKRLRELGLLALIHPAFSRKSVESLLKQIQGILASYKMIPFQKSPEFWLCYLYGLLFELSDEELNEAFERLQFPVKIQERILKDFEIHRKFVGLVENNREALGPYEIYDSISQLSVEAIVLTLAVSGNKKIKDYVFLYLTQYHQLAQINLTGEDLISLGLKPGPLFQKVFKAIRMKRLKGEIKTREDEMVLVKNEYAK